MTLIKYPKDFTAFVSLVPVSNVPYAFNGIFGWLLYDDILAARKTEGNSNDERTGPEQTYFVPILLQRKFGPKTASYLIENSGGGHAGRAALAEELTFIGIQGGISSR